MKYLDIVLKKRKKSCISAKMDRTQEKNIKTKQRKNNYTHEGNKCLINIGGIVLICGCVAHQASAHCGY